jgi:hypothetical protein
LEEISHETHEIGETGNALIQILDAQQFGSVMDGHQIDRITADSVNDPVIPLQHLAIRGSLVFGNDAAKMRIGLQQFDAVNDLLAEAPGSYRRIAFDEFEKPFQIIETSGRPD